MSVVAVIMFALLASAVGTYVIIDPIHPLPGLVSRFFEASVTTWVIGIGVWFLRFLAEGHAYSSRILTPSNTGDRDSIGIFHQRGINDPWWEAWPEWMFALPFYASALAGVVALGALIYFWMKPREAMRAPQARASTSNGWNS